MRRSDPRTRAGRWSDTLTADRDMKRLRDAGHERAVDEVDGDRPAVLDRIVRRGVRIPQKRGHGAAVRDDEDRLVMMRGSDPLDGRDDAIGQPLPCLAVVSDL